MHIVYVGYPGFPLGHAQVERQKLIAKGLANCGCDVTVISRYGTHKLHDSLMVPDSGKYEDVNFKYASGIIYRPENFLIRNLYKAKGLINELCLIYKYQSTRKLDAIIITTNSFYNVVLYSCVSYSCGVASVLDNVEYWSSRTGVGFWEKLDNYLYDRYAYKFVNNVICISDFLLNIVKKGSPRKPVIKIPVVVDFSKFENRSIRKEPYFLFCGSGVYYDIINFIIEAYEKLNNDNYKLYIVSIGTPQQIGRLKDRIDRSTQRTSIKYYTNLSSEELAQLYTSSKALLIPLLDRKQDKARFPHKIGEYCASKKVIITTKIGEVASYFTNMENALVADVPTTDHFSAKMQYVIDHPETALIMGENSYASGKKHFDYIKIGRKIFDFLQQKMQHT